MFCNELWALPQQKWKHLWNPSHTMKTCEIHSIHTIPILEPPVPSWPVRYVNNARSWFLVESWPVTATVAVAGGKWEQPVWLGFSPSQETMWIRWRGYCSTCLQNLIDFGVAQNEVDPSRTSQFSSHLGTFRTLQRFNPCRMSSYVIDHAATPTWFCFIPTRIRPIWDGQERFHSTTAIRTMIALWMPNIRASNPQKYAFWLTISKSCRTYY